MTSPLGKLIFLALVMSGVPSAHAGGAPASIAVPERVVPSRVLLVLEDAAKLSAIAARHRVKLEPLRSLGGSWALYFVTTEAGFTLTESQTEELANRLVEDPAVVASSPDYVYRTVAVPDDDDLDVQWNLTTIGAAAAWDLGTGLDTQRIGVIDSGIRRNHRDLTDKDAAGYDFITDETAANDNDARDDDYADDFDQADCNGTQIDGDFHGTAVSGVILAMTNNNRGMAGINWGAQLVTARAVGLCGVAVMSDVIDAVRWLAGDTVTDVPDIGTDKVSVINLSLARAGACSTAEQDAFDFAAAQGVAVVAGAGNGGGAVEAPANCNEVIAVGALSNTTDRAMAPYSARGAGVDLFAPGGSIATSETDGIYTLLGAQRDGYAYFEGTSFAAAHVTGAVALVQALDATRTTSQIVSTLRRSAAACAGCASPLALQLDIALDAVVNGPPIALEGERCGSDIVCDGGLFCTNDGSTADTCRVMCDPSSGDGCKAEQHCLPLNNLLGSAACLPAGNVAIGSGCIHPSDCAVGAICIPTADRTGNVCARACHHGFTCSADETCVMLNPFQSYCIVDEPEPEPEPEPIDPGPVDPIPEDKTCRVSAGIFDCNTGEGCINDGDGDDLGFCAAWSGGRQNGELCDTRFDCASGICGSGVCLFGCDAGACVAGYTCDTSAFDGGVCRPDDCGASSNLCAGGWSCEMTSAGQTVCAQSAGGCRVVAKKARSSSGWLLVLLGLPLVLRRRGQLA